MDGIWLTDIQGRFLEVNETYCRMSGYSSAELLSMSISDLEAKESAPETATHISLIMEQGEGRFESVHRRKDGTTFHVEVSIQYRPLNSGLLVVFIHDISKRIQAEKDRLLLEQQYQQTQKLESLGVMAGGIAHDFNNILTVIISSCSLAQLRPNMAGELLLEIDKAAQRAAELCRQMLNYAGKTIMTMKRLKIRELVEDMISMLKATVSHNVTILFDCSDALPPVSGDAGQLRQVVMNLIINASEAIVEEQGNIHVKLVLTNVIKGISDKDYNGTAIPAGQYVCLEVTDNGCGMDEETRNRIFEPFFTTKFTGRGLGMSATLGIIQAHIGALQFFSQPGQGTTFMVYLPVPVKHEIGETLSSTCITPVQWGGSGTILLVEDESQLLMVASNLIKALGFSVIGASNGKEALELYHKHSSDIGIVLTDMGMPIMDGYSLFRELKALTPELPIIISSGFGDTVVNTRIPNKEIAGMISKPYRFDQLRDVLKSVVSKMSL
jgi:PAS domain S-box-containing protein